MSVITGARERANREAGRPGWACRGQRAGSAPLVVLALSAGGCTLTTNEFEPSPVVVESELPAPGGPSAPRPPRGNAAGPAPMLAPGEGVPPADFFPPGAGSENAGGARPGTEGAVAARDAGLDASDADDGGDPSSSDPDAATPPGDAAAPRDAAAMPLPPPGADAGAAPSGAEPSPAPGEPDASAPPPPAPCPGLVFEGSCYEFFAGPLAWAAAEEHCVAWGGHLASVESYEEDAFLGAWPALLGVPFGEGSGLWLGGSDALRDGDFRWWGDRPLGYVGWAPDQPNNGPGVDCIEKRNDVTQRWYDRRCVDGERYVCERSD